MGYSFTKELNVKLSSLLEFEHFTLNPLRQQMDAIDLTEVINTYGINDEFFVVPILR